ncbi:MAG: tetratricopeptide repeat protein [Varibaculum sp.]|nr:tetratricopeptide repeat protein [Varibaculum sp.]
MDGSGEKCFQGRADGVGAETGRDAKRVSWADRRSVRRAERKRQRSAEENILVTVPQQRRSRWLWIIGIPFATLLALFGLWFITVWVWSFTAASAQLNGDIQRAESGFSALVRITPFGPERWRGYYNLGTTELINKRIDAGVADLEAALRLDPPGDGSDPSSAECMVRMNLAAGYRAQNRDDEATQVQSDCAASGQSGNSGDSDSDDQSNQNNQDGEDNNEQTDPDNRQGQRDQQQGNPNEQDGQDSEIQRKQEELNRRNSEGQAEHDEAQKNRDSFFGGGGSGGKHW